MGGDRPYLTPNDEFFTVKHYDLPQLSPTDWRLGVTGLVAHPLTLSLADLKALPRRAVTFALECSGNTGRDAVRHRRHRQRPLGRRVVAPGPAAGTPARQGIEVIFWGADKGAVTIRDNSGVIRPGDGDGEPDASRGLDLTITEQFARSMSLEDAMSRDNLLCYEMNGVPLPRTTAPPCA